MIGITITPSLPHILISNNLSIETYVLKAILPNDRLGIDENGIEEIDTINLLNIVKKMRKTKTVSEFLLYLSSYAKNIERIEEKTER